MNEDVVTTVKYSVTLATIRTPNLFEYLCTCVSVRQAWAEHLNQPKAATGTRTLEIHPTVQYTSYPPTRVGRKKAERVCVHARICASGNE